MHCLNILQVDHKARELTDGDKAVLCWSHLDLRFHWATLEGKLIDRNIKLDWTASLIRLILDDFGKVEEFLSKLLLSLPLPFFKLKLIEVVHSSPTSLHVQIVSGDTRFFEKLNV
jgi:hypothetical protein